MFCPRIDPWICGVAVVVLPTLLRDGRGDLAKRFETYGISISSTTISTSAPPSSVATSAIEDAHDIIHPYGLSEDPGIPEKMLAATLLEKSSVTTALHILAACS